MDKVYSTVYLTIKTQLFNWSIVCSVTKTMSTTTLMGHHSGSEKHIPVWLIKIM